MRSAVDADPSPPELPLSDLTGIPPVAGAMPVIGDGPPPAGSQVRPRRGRAVTMVTFQAPDTAALDLVPRRRRRATSPFDVDLADVPDTDAANSVGRPAGAGPGQTATNGGNPRSKSGRALDLAHEPEPEPDRPTAYADVDEEELPDPAAADDGDGDGDGDNSTRRRRRGRRGRGRARVDEELEGADDEFAITVDRPGTRSDEFDDGDGSGRSGRIEAGDSRDPRDDDDLDDSDAEGAGLAPGAAAGTAAGTAAGGYDEDQPVGSSRRRRRRRRRDGTAIPDDIAPDDPPATVVHVRENRVRDDEVRGVSGSTRLEAKRQRRKEGRDNGRRRPPIVTEAEFLARREAVERRMVVRNAGDRTQIAVLEDGVLVEHFVTRASSWSYAGNVYLGRVQNVLASMEAAFVDVGKGRNAVLYAGEVNYDASGLDGRPRKIEQVLKSGQSIVVQVSKDPMGHKGARLTSQVSLPGRYLVYVPDGQNAGISRKLPDTERARLKTILKKITPENGGVIVRTAAEGASEQELALDVARLSAQWEDIRRKAGKATAPALLYGEPDLVIRVIRDIFNEDFAELVVQGVEEATMIEDYVDMVAPDLRERVRRHADTVDVFDEYRVDEQLAKALDRKVWLPSGGSLVIDRTEAMTVIDVNTGKFTGKGGNLEETVTKNNLEAAEEIVRQLRLRDIGGIIVIDFIDMVLESNRELVLRRLTECLGRDRTRHQVAEVTSLGLVQMTRKRVGQGLLEAYSEPCAHCGGRGVIVHLDGQAAPPGRASGPPDLPALDDPLAPDDAPADAAADADPNGETVAAGVGAPQAVSADPNPTYAGPGQEPTLDGVTSDGGTSDGVTSDGGTSDGGTSDGATSGSGLPSSNGPRAAGARAAGRRRASRAAAAPQEAGEAAHTL
ncbi:MULTISPECIES: Rne/Rng family ribonuclease [unclassified Frankia]|uniref:Rne/Rng family ribonuclease n=1 Tax=unclassified Frankia TaxID=2632575 RepID=UPI002AD2883E|nr:MULTISPECIES: Rne/Rng family ribonuclease [unclassified Frankia]